MDKSFEGLVFSLLVHAALVWMLLHGQAPSGPQSQPVEIEFIDKNAKTPQTIVKDTEKDADVFDKLKDQANYLSKLTKRVKEEMTVKKETDLQKANTPQVPNLNPQMKLEPPQQSRRSRNAGMQAQERGETEQKRGEGMRQSTLPPMMLSERILGLKSGGFTALNTDQMTYYTFYERVNEQVRNRWVGRVRQFLSEKTYADLEALSKFQRATQVELILNARGEFVQTVLHRSSGDRGLDQTHIQSLIAALPFVNPPRGMLEADGRIHMFYHFFIEFGPPSLSPEYN